MKFFNIYFNVFELFLIVSPLIIFLCSLIWTIKYRLLLVTFSLLLSGTIIVTNILTVYIAFDRDNAFTIGFMASLWQDIIFFGILGFVVFMSQSTTYIKGFKLSNRIDILLNKKNLNEVEEEYFQEKLKEIVTYGVRGELHIIIEAADPTTNRWNIIVDRTLVLASYLKDSVAYYTPSIGFAATDSYNSKDTKIGEIRKYEVITNRGPSDKLDGTIREINSSEPTIRPAIKFERIEIGANEEITINSRYSVEDLFTDGYTIVIGQPWDQCILTVDNNTDYHLDIMLKNGAEEPVTIKPNVRHQEIWDVDKIAADSTLMFEGVEIR